MSGYRVDAAIAVADGYTIVENGSLQERNSFRVAARADLVVDVRTCSVLPELFALAGVKSRPVLVLGAGSNVLFTRDWPGIALSIVARGIRVLDDDGATARIRVAAGENWNDLVHWSIGNGFAGFENLVLIPGTVGAAPIQNIGAYGVEVGEFVARVEAFDRERGASAWLDAADCAFGYRDSLFKRAGDRFVITAIEFDLPRRRPLQIGYAGVAEELAAIGAAVPTPATVAEAIARLRTRKLPNPALIGNAGSFFKNPMLAADAADALRRAHPALPAWPTDEGRVKVSAAWLIDACGLRGSRIGDAGVSMQHALVLVNHGSASGAELWALAEHVRATVAARFGIELEAEPRIV